LDYPDLDNLEIDYAIAQSFRYVALTYNISLLYYFYLYEHSTYICC